VHVEQGAEGEGVVGVEIGYRTEERGASQGE
jgi:hypothetical protein